VIENTLSFVKNPMSDKEHTTYKHHSFPEAIVEAIYPDLTNRYKIKLWPNELRFWVTWEKELLALGFEPIEKEQEIVQPIEKIDRTEEIVSMVKYSKDWIDKARILYFKAWWTDDCRRHFRESITSCMPKEAVGTDTRISNEELLGKLSTAVIMTLRDYNISNKDALEYERVMRYILEDPVNRSRINIDRCIKCKLRTKCEESLLCKECLEKANLGKSVDTPTPPKENKMRECTSCNWTGNDWEYKCEICCWTRYVEIDTPKS